MKTSTSYILVMVILLLIMSGCPINVVNQATEQLEMHKSWRVRRQVVKGLR